MDENTVTVTGVGGAALTPDAAQLEIAVEAVDANPSVAYTEVNDVGRRVLAVLDEHGVAEADRRTRSVALHPENHQPGAGRTVANLALAVRVTSLPATSGILDALVGAAGPALRLNGFTLISTDTADAQARAEEAAVDDARQRAARLAAAAGVALGPVVTIREEHAGGGMFRATALGFEGRQSASVPIQAGTDGVAARLTVTFALGEPVRPPG